jgi:hypothetical protein
LKLINYFSIEKGVDRVYNPVDRVHGVGSRVYEILIKPEPSIRRSTTWIKTIKGVSGLLISSIQIETDNRDDFSFLGFGSR